MSSRHVLPATLPAVLTLVHLALGDSDRAVGWLVLTVMIWSMGGLYPPVAYGLGIMVLLCVALGALVWAVLSVYARFYKRHHSQ